MVWEEALTYCDTLSWGGYSDWRLPDEYALQSIVNYEQYSPSIDENAFPATAAAGYWSSSSYAADIANAWYMHFYHGEVRYYSKDNDSSVRCVRGGGTIGQTVRFTRGGTVSDEPVVEDTVSDLVWQGCTAGQSGADCTGGNAVFLLWGEALAYCENLTWGGYDDWRLPSVVELKSIADNREYGSSIDENAFPETVTTSYWSSTSTSEYNGDYAWLVHFNRGDTEYDHKIYYNYYLRCVRSGP